MMISSPKRDYMISSPRRDYMMISSPKRDYMISSPKREYMVTVTSPKRSSMGSSTMSASIYSHNYGYVNHGVQPYVNSNDSSSFNTKGKSPSPLHKVFNSSSYGTGVGPEAVASLALPTMDALLDEYGLYGNLKEECAAASEQVYEVAGAGDQAEEEAAVGGMSATLLECLAMPSLNARYGEGGGVSDHGHGDDDGHGHHGYGHGHGHGMGGHHHHHDHHQQQLMGSVSNCKSELVGDVSSNYQGLLGSIASSLEQTEQVIIFFMRISG